MEEKNETQTTRIAVGVIIFKENKVLIIRRQGSQGAGEYAFPGGKLEYNESFEECCKREIKEETDVEIENLKFITVFNSTAYDRHFIVLGFTADWAGGEAQIMEPHKCDYIGWHDINNLPQPFFEHSATILEGYKSNKNYFDKK